MEKQEAKKQIGVLVAKFKQLEIAGGIKKLSEADTKRKFIEPLFEALGWDFTNPAEIVMEENVIGQRADYGFYLNGRAQFYLEAKAAGADIHREDFAKQAWRYAWNKSIPWAVLTDFKVLKIFNSESTSKKILDHKVLELNLDNYLTEFNDLWLLSKEAFLINALDVFAEKIGKKTGKVTVTETLAKDLNKIRQELIEAFKISNPDLKLDLIEEGVQTMIDRLIFIRVAEDRGIEPQTLKPILREWETKGKQGSIFAHMVSKFRELDKVYNSDLFSPHALEKWEEYHADMKRILQILYGEPDNYEYDFKAIPADVLGAVYENYLGYKLQKTKKDLFGQNMSLGKDLKKRKEQGIYYTPKFIVDYIVKNALGPVLNKCTSVEQLKKIKILDPACGSGSFLVAAFGEIVKKYEEFNYKSSAYLKMNILKENIYGVDLDGQAVQLARLNLILNVFDSQFKLQNLDHNIKNGNSLISGSDEELKKYFGKNYRDKNPFNWQEEFPEVFKQGGFDVIIGNPPYVGARELGQEDKTFFERNFTTAKEQYDLYILFVEKSLNLLKKSGYLSFIVPNKFLVTKYGLELRKLISETATLVAFQDYSDANVFPDASVYPVVIVLDKTKSSKTKITGDYNLLGTFGFTKSNSVISKIEGIKEAAKIKVWRPIAASSNVIEGSKIVVSNREISRYYLNPKNRGNLDKVREIDFAKNKILMKKLCYNLEASLDEVGYYPINTTYCIKPENTDSKYILGLLNSKLLTYYVRQKYSETALRGGFIELRVFQIEKLPLVFASKSKQKIVASLVDKILQSNEQFRQATENSNEWQRIKDEIAKTDQKIEQEVYKLYGLTDEEIKIIEKAA